MKKELLPTNIFSENSILDTNMKYILCDRGLLLQKDVHGRTSKINPLFPYKIPTQKLG